MASNAEWLRDMARRIDEGQEVRPCAKALRRVADELDRWVPSLGKPSALSGMTVVNPAPHAAAPQVPTGKYFSGEIS